MKYALIYSVFLCFVVPEHIIIFELLGIAHEGLYSLQYLFEKTLDYQQNLGNILIVILQTKIFSEAN